MSLALFEVSNGGALSPAVADIPFRPMLSKHVSVDVHKFPPKKRPFTMFGSSTSSGVTEKSFAQEHVNQDHFVVNICEESAKKDSLPRKRPRLENSPKINLDALTYYPAEFDDDKDDAGDVSGDTSSDEDYQIVEELKGRLQASWKRIDRVTRSNPKRRLSYAKSSSGHGYCNRES